MGGSWLQAKGKKMWWCICVRPAMQEAEVGGVQTDLGQKD
jgi:hypothetical protein